MVAFNSVSKKRARGVTPLLTIHVIPVALTFFTVRTRTHKAFGLQDFFLLTSSLWTAFFLNSLDQLL